MEGKIEGPYLFTCLLLANFLQYLEAGAVPALLLQLSESFNMGSAQQGLLGGVVYLSIGVGGPFAGFLLRNFEHKTVISCAVAMNMVFTLLWALTPVGRNYSATLFLSLRFMMGLCQCVICVFLPLWTNDNAPSDRRTQWMSYLQASVPFGVMCGYIVASIFGDAAAHETDCAGLLCWRWPLLIEIMLLSPLYLCLYFVHKESLQISLLAPTKSASHRSQTGTLQLSEKTGNSAESSVSLSLTAVPQSSKSGWQRPQSTSQDSYPRPLSLEHPAAHGSPLRMGHQTLAEAEHGQRRVHITPEQRHQYRALRRAAISASLVEPLSTKYALKKSCDNILRLAPETEPFPALPGLRNYDTEDEFAHHGASRDGASAHRHTATSLSLAIPPLPTPSRLPGRPPKSPKAPPQPSARKGSASRSRAERALDADSDEDGGNGGMVDGLSDDDGAAWRFVGSAKAAGRPPEYHFRKVAGDDPIRKARSRSGDAASGTPRGKRTARTPAAGPDLGPRRQSLGDWIMGSLPRLPYTASKLAMEKEYGRSPRTSLPCPSPADRNRRKYGTRRSLDSNLRLKSSRKSVEKGTRAGSTTAPPCKQPQTAAAPMEYESFREISRGGNSPAFSRHDSANKRTSWDVFSILGMQGGEGRSRSNSLAGDGPALPRFAARSSIGSAGPANGGERVRDHSTRSQSAGDIADLAELDFNGRESPCTPAPIPIPVRSRHYSDSVVTSEATPLLCTGKPGKLADRAVDPVPSDDEEESRFRESWYSGRGDQDGYDDEEDDGTCDEDENSDVSYVVDDGSYAMEHPSEEDSEEEWEGLTPPVTTSTRGAMTPPTAERRNLFAGSTSAERASFSGRRRSWGPTPDVVAASVKAIAKASVEEDEETAGVCTRCARSCRRTYRYLRAVVQSVYALLKIRTYRCLLGALTALYFSVTGVQFWGTKYLAIALHAPLPLVSLLFVTCAATGPTLGVFFGGWIVDKMGGYKGAHQRVVALELCATFGVLAFAFSLPLTLFSNIYLVVSLLWLMLFFGGAMLPACSGILVSIIPRSYRPTSSALALMVFNMFGYSLSLLLSGYLMQFLDDHRASCDAVCSMTWGFRLVLFWSVFSVYGLISALFASYEHLKDRDRGRSGRHQPSRRRKRLAEGDCSVSPV